MTSNFVSPPVLAYIRVVFWALWKQFCVWSVLPQVLETIVNGAPSVDLEVFCIPTQLHHLIDAAYNIPAIRFWLQFGLCWSSSSSSGPTAWDEIRNIHSPLRNEASLRCGMSSAPGRRYHVPSLSCFPTVFSGRHTWCLQTDICRRQLVARGEPQSSFVLPRCTFSSESWPSIRTEKHTFSVTMRQDLHLKFPRSKPVWVLWQISKLLLRRFGPDERKQPCRWLVSHQLMSVIMCLHRTGFGLSRLASAVAKVMFHRGWHHK